MKLTIFITSYIPSSNVSSVAGTYHGSQWECVLHLTNCIGCTWFDGCTWVLTFFVDTCFSGWTFNVSFTSSVDWNYEININVKERYIDYTQL